MRGHATRHRTLSSAIALLLLGCGTAQGAAFSLLEQSASRIGTAFAGTAAASDDATAVYFNPAGLVHLPGPEATVLASAIEITSELRNTASAAALGQPLGGSGGDAGDWNFVPGVYLSVPLTDALSVGFGVNAPFGLKLEYDRNWIGRFQAIDSDLETMNFNPTVAFRINERLAVGVGANFQRVQAELTNAVNYTAVIAQGLQQLAAAGQIPASSVPTLIAANTGVEGVARVSGDDGAWGYNVGFMFDVSAATRLGLSYRSAISYEVEGSASFTQPTVTQPTGAAIVAMTMAPGGPLANGPVSVDLEMPDSAIFSLRQRLGRQLELLADVAWTGWSSIQELRVVRESGATLSVTPERWNDAWRFALGGTYALRPALKLRAGVAYDETPVPDSTRTPRLPDGDRTWLALGAQWKPTDAITFDVGYVHIFTETVPLNQDAGNAAVNGVIVGEQESDIDILSAQMVYRF